MGWVRIRKIFNEIYFYRITSAAVQLLAFWSEIFEIQFLTVAYFLKIARHLIRIIGVDIRRSLGRRNIRKIVIFKKDQFSFGILRDFFIFFP